MTAVYSPLRAESRFVDELLALPLHEIIALDMHRAVGPWDLASYRALGRLIRDKGPFDIVHGHSSKAGALTRLATLPGRNPPVLYTPHAFRTMDPTLGSKGRLVYGGVERLLDDFSATGSFAFHRTNIITPSRWAFRRVHSALSPMASNIRPATYARRHARTSALPMSTWFSVSSAGSWPRKPRSG